MTVEYTHKYLFMYPSVYTGTKILHGQVSLIVEGKVAASSLDSFFSLLL